MLNLTMQMNKMSKIETTKRIWKILIQNQKANYYKDGYIMDVYCNFVFNSRIRILKLNNLHFLIVVQFYFTKV